MGLDVPHPFLKKLKRKDLEVAKQGPPPPPKKVVKPPRRIVLPGKDMDDYYKNTKTIFVGQK